MKVSKKQSREGNRSLILVDDKRKMKPTECCAKRKIIMNEQVAQNSFVLL